jgi:hypothetical protein
MQYVLTKEEYEELQTSKELAKMLEQTCQNLEYKLEMANDLNAHRSKRINALLEQVGVVQSTTLNIGTYPIEIVDAVCEGLKGVMKKMKDGKVGGRKITCIRRRYRLGKELNDKARAVRATNPRAFTYDGSVAREYASVCNLYLDLGV